MGKWDGVREAQGVHDAMGVKAIITDMEKGETGENAATPGCLMFTVSLRITEPPECEGYELRDWFVIGTKDDKRAKKDATWHRSEAGPGKLARLLKRAGVDPTDDDEEWMDALIDKEVCLHMTKGPSRDGSGMQNRVGLYFRENDDQFVGIGEKLADEGARGRGGRQGRGGDSRANGKERPRQAAKDEDEGEEKPRSASSRRGKDEDDDQDDDDKPPRSARGGRAVARRDADED